MTQIASLLGGGPKPNKISGQTPALLKPKPSEKTVNTVNKIKKKFDPQTMSNAMGKPLGDDTVNKLTGQDDKKDPIKVAPNSGKKVGKLDTANYSSISEDQKQRMRKGDGVADVVAKVINFMKAAREQTKTQRELTRDFKKEEHEKEKRAHESLLRQIKGDREPEEQSLTHKGATLEKVSKIGAEEHPEVVQRVTQTNATPASAGHPLQNFGKPEPKEGVLSSVAKFALSTTSRGISAVSRGIGSVLSSPVGAAAAGAAGATLAAKGVASGKFLNAGIFTKIPLPDGSVESREGGTISWRNNNPGNLRNGSIAKENGSIGESGGFAVFPTLEAGEKARYNLLFNSNLYKNLSVRQAISKYAPPSENNTENYIKQVTTAIGVPDSTPVASLNESQKQAWLKASEKVEGFTPGRVAIVKPDGSTTPGSPEPTRVAVVTPQTTAPSVGQQLNKVSTENSDMKKDSDGGTLALVNNSTVVNNTIRPKTVNIVQRPPMSDTPQLLQNKLSYV